MNNCVVIPRLDRGIQKAWLSCFALDPVVKPRDDKYEGRDRSKLPLPH
ncbi:MAG: palindromic element RPE4 domain-containing protein [Alphaproteobacteria bacterium]|nr:MAG: palindromic element RPE4 domain-containing protein [Alphaproteobacteria bacterium]